MTRATWFRHAGLLAWIAYFIVPNDGGGLVHGMPLGPLEATALLALAWLAARNEVPRHSWIFLVVLIVSGTSAALIPGTGGLRARYFANADASGAPERSTEFSDDSFTRVDRRLDFAIGATEFPLAFFNDVARFNFQNPAGPRRRYLEFSATWAGQWWTADGAHTLYLDAPDASAQLFVDGASVATVSPETGIAEIALPLAAGWHRLDVTFSSPYGAPRQLSAGTVASGARHPFSAADVVTQRVRSWQVRVLKWLRVAKTAGDGATLAWRAVHCGVSLWRLFFELAATAGWWRQRSRVAPLLAIVASVDALVHAWPWSRQLMIMRGGDDPLTYEWYSRDILFNGILMNGGLPAGQGEPFYYQAFYPYFLAGAHALFGEGMFGVLLIQRLLVAFTIWAIVRIAVEIAGEWVWPWTLACGLVFAVWKQAPIAADLSNEALYVPLLVGWIVAVLLACRMPSPANALVTGVVGAITAMTRSTILTAWPIVFMVCWWAWRRTAAWRLPLAILVLSSIAVFSLVTVRNWIVARQLVVTSTGLGPTLLGGNPPPPDVTIDLRTRGALYQRLGLTDHAAQVVEFAIVAPAAFIRLQGRKALFALGYYEPYAAGWGYSLIYILGWPMIAAGLVVSLRQCHRPRATILLPAVVAASQFVTVVAIFPGNERLILPIYALLAPYAGIGLGWAALAARPRAA